MIEAPPNEIRVLLLTALDRVREYEVTMAALSRENSNLRTDKIEGKRQNQNLIRNFHDLRLKHQDLLRQQESWGRSDG